MVTVSIYSELAKYIVLPVDVIQLTPVGSGSHFPLAMHSAYISTTEVLHLKVILAPSSVLACEVIMPLAGADGAPQSTMK